MGILYKSLKRANPQDRTQPEKYYAAIAKNGSSDFETLAEMISEQSALSSTDCLAVLNILEVNIVRELRQGRIVRLGKLGSFQVSISSMDWIRKMKSLRMPTVISTVTFQLWCKKKCKELPSGITTGSMAHQLQDGQCMGLCLSKILIHCMCLICKLKQA